MAFWREIRRRKVFQVAAAYLVVAWAIMQVIDVVNEPLNVPSWFATVAILLLAIGFPIALILSWAYDVTPQGVVRDDRSGPSAARGMDYGRATFWAVLGVAILLGASVIFERPAQKEEVAERQIDSSLRRFSIELPRTMRVRDNEFRPVTISADGRRLIFNARVAQKDSIYSRSIDSLEVVGIEGTENASRDHALSPDGEWIVFVDRADQLIKKIPAMGGVPLVLGDSDELDERNVDLTWGANDEIIYAAERYAGLLRLPASGGESEQLTAPENGDVHKQPSVSPDGNAVVFTIGERGTTTRRTDRIYALSLATGEQKALMRGSSPQITSTGHLIYYLDGALWAAAFDSQTLEVKSDSLPVEDGIHYASEAHYSLSDDGTLIYVLATNAAKRSLVWVDQSGNEELVELERRPYNMVRVSPDGSTIAVVVDSETGPDLWMYSLERGTSARMTFDESRETSPVWSPDGRYIYYSSNRVDDLFRVTTDGSGLVEQLTDSTEYQFPHGITPDGGQLLYHERGPNSKMFDISILTLSNPFETQSLMRTEFSELAPVLSPDGRWLAYVSLQSGNPEVYMRPFPIIGGRSWQLSVGSGFQPTWGAGGRELYYWGPTELMSVTVETDPEIIIGKPRALFSTQNYIFEGNRSYDYDPNRRHFMMVRKPSEEDIPTNRIIVVQNWLDFVAEKVASN